MINKKLANKLQNGKEQYESKNEVLEAYHSIFMQAAEAILIIKNKKIFDCNKAAEILFSRTKDELVGKSPISFSPKYQSDGKLSTSKAKLFFGKASEEYSQFFEWIHNKADGSQFIVQISLNTFTIQGEMFIGAFLRDISDLKRKDSDLELYQVALETLVKEKTDNLEKINEELSVTIKFLTATNNELNKVNKELTSTIKKYEHEKEVRKDLQNLLQSSQVKLKAFISQSAEGLAIIDGDAKVIEWNDKMVEITGIDYSKAIFKNMYDIEFGCIPKSMRTPDNYVRIKRDTLSLISNTKNPKVQVFEGKLETPKGENKIVSITIFPIKTDKIILYGYIFNDITQKKRQENELEYYQKHLEDLVLLKTDEVYDLSRQFNELFNNSSDGIFFITQTNDNSYKYTRINKPGLKALNSAEENIVFPINIDKLNSTTTLENLKKNLKKCLEERRPINFEEIRSFPANDSIWSTTLIPFKDKNGEFRSLAGFSRNITIAKQVQDVEEFVMELYKSSQSLIMVFNRNGQIINFNAECERVTGYHFNEFKGVELWNHPIMINDDKIVFKEQFGRIIAHEIESFDLYTNWKTRDNQLKWIYLRNTCIRDKNGELKYLISTGIDFTERKQYEIMLRESEIQYRSLFETMNDALVIIDPIINESCDIIDFSIIDYNPAFNRFIGKTELSKNSNASTFFGALSEDFINSIISVYKDGIPIKYEGRNEKLNKSFSSSIFKPRKGHIAILLSDVTEQRAIESALIASEYKFRNIFDSSEDGIAIISKEQVLVQGNPALQRMIAASNNHFYDGNIFDIIPPNYINLVRQSVEDLFNQKTISNLDIELLGYDGRKFPVELSARLIDYDGEPAILTIIRDTTERKSIEKVLLNTIIETEERERRRLAGDLHDEMGPILASLRMYLSILQQKLKESEYTELLNIMMNLTKNSIENIRTISNNISPHLIERYGLASAINAEVDNVRLLLPISFQTNTSGIKFSRDVEIIFYRIIKELINNTIKYAKASSSSIILNFDKSSLYLQYSDDGIGLDLEVIEKEKNKGLGLFNIVNRIKSIDGDYSYVTSPGKGFNFTLSAKTTLR